MPDDLWIVIPNWDTFQHYTDRNPTWMKVYFELDSRDDWRRLTYTERGLLVSIWLEYGRSGGLLRATDLGGRCGQKARTRSLTSLNHQGWIQLSASKPLALTRSREGEKSKSKNPKPHASVGAPELNDLTKALEPRPPESTPRAQGTSPRQRGLSPRQLASFTGCRWVRGTHSATHIYDPAGRDQPPADWPYPRPTFEEVKAALERSSAPNPESS